MSSAPTEITATQRVLSTDIRAKIMRIVYDELCKLPELLAEMEPEKRLNYVFKLLPHAAPYMDKLNPTYGEPLNWDGVDLSDAPLNRGDE